MSINKKVCLLYYNEQTLIFQSLNNCDPKLLWNTSGRHNVTQQNIDKNFAQEQKSKSKPTDDEQQSDEHSKPDLFQAPDIDISIPTNAPNENDRANSRLDINTKRNTQSTASTNLKRATNENEEPTQNETFCAELKEMFHLTPTQISLPYTHADPNCLTTQQTTLLENGLVKVIIPGLVRCRRIGFGYFCTTGKRNS